MKRLIFIFIALFYTTTQVAANQCAVDCLSLNRVETKKSATPNKMKEDHSCCHGKDEKSQKDSKHKDGEGNCFHEIVGEQSNSSETQKYMVTSSKLIQLKQLPVAEFINKVELVANFNYRPKIPHIQNEFLAYRARIQQYIIKEQFLN